MNYYVTLSRLRQFECRPEVYNDLAVKHFGLDESDPEHWIRENGCIKLPLELREQPIGLMDIRKHCGTYTALWAIRAIEDYPPARLALYWRGRAYNTKGVDGALLTAKTIELLKGEF